VDALRHHEAKFPEVGADSVGKPGQLPDQKIPCPMAYQHRLLRPGLARHEAHHRLHNGRADRLGIRGIGLAPLYEGFDTEWRDQAHLMAGLRQFARPEMRPGTGHYADQARLQTGEEQQHLRPPDLPPDDNRTGCIDGVDLEHVPGQIEPGRGNLIHGWLPSWVRVTALNVAHCDAGSGSHPLHQWRTRGLIASRTMVQC